MITAPGIYDIPEAEYHGGEICDSPSISSSGLREIARCPRKYWFSSPLNPDRPETESKPHFAVGRAAHMLVLEGAVKWSERFHTLPDGFDARATKRWADAIAEKEAAEAAGKTVLKHDDAAAVWGMARELAAHPLAKAFSRGKAEQTLTWKDEETGIWLRCRPDFLPDDRNFIPDYKTTTSAHPDDFARDVATLGYHMQAALYLDGIEAVFGVRPQAFYFVAQEKAAPYIVQPFALDAEALDWGRRQNRAAIRTFAGCLKTGKWVGYSDDFVTVSLPAWRVNQLENSYREVFSEC